MASLKAEKPVGSQTMFGQAKKELAKATDGASKGPALKPAAKKAQPKPKKGKGGKPASKN